MCVCMCVCLYMYCRRQHRKDNYLHLKPFRGNNNIMNLIIHMIRAGLSILWAPGKKNTWAP